MVVRLVSAEWLTYYVQLGVKVFPVHSVIDQGGRLACTCGADPCKRAGKHPVAQCAPRGFHDATADHTILEQWWTQVPTANIGIATGNGLVVVDIDPRKGGDSSLSQLQAELGGELDTPLRVLTGGGGKHLYFRADGVVRNDVDLLPGIDLRGDGGYVIAPPSRHASGGVYSLEQVPLRGLKDLPALPARFVRVDKAKRATAVPSASGRISQGQRNQALTSIAGSMRRYAASGEVIEKVIHAVNGDLFDPPLNVDELRRTVASVAKYEPTAAPEAAFSTAASILTAAPAGVKWMLPGYLAAGVLTELIGQPKAGKSTLVQAMVRTVLGLGPFLDRSGETSPVLLLTEEHEVTLRQALVRSGLNSEHLHILSRMNVRHASWPDIIELSLEKMLTCGARLLIVDTVSSWALGTNDENSAGDALRIVEPLLRVTANDIAVLMVRHQRKGGGDVVVAGRGSSAFAGASDIVLSLQHHPTRRCARVLESASRFHETPPKLVIELTRNGFVSLGDGQQIKDEEDDDAVVGVLPADPERALKIEEIGVALDEAKHPLGKTKIKDVADRLIDRGAVAQTGEGKKNDPFRYWALSTVVQLPGAGAGHPSTMTMPPPVAGSPDACSTAVMREPRAAGERGEGSR